MDRNYQTAIIIGAARSGTNLLRDLLSQLPGSGTWPCDEINYIWRYGNRDYPTDELPATLATPRVVRYVRRAFDRMAATRGLSTVVEKTCASSLRVPFVNAIFPEAKFVHLVRDGRDAAVSARERWCAGLDWAYVARKARYVPVADIPSYAFGYLRNRLYRLRSRDKRLKTWGPRHESLLEDLQHGSLLEVCALQWKQCVDAADRSLAQIEPHRVCSVKYEQLVNTPADEIRRLAEFLDIETDQPTCRRLSASVRSTSLGRARCSLSSEELATMEAICEDTLLAHDYELLCTSATSGLHMEGEGGILRHSEGTRRRAG